MQSHIGIEKEAAISVQLSHLNLAGSQAGSEDSFSSSPDTTHNKGALAFLKLVEDYSFRLKKSNILGRFAVPIG